MKHLVNQNRIPNDAKFKPCCAKSIVKIYKYTTRWCHFHSVIREKPKINLGYHMDNRKQCICRFEVSTLAAYFVH